MLYFFGFIIKTKVIYYNKLTMILGFIIFKCKVADVISGHVNLL